MAARAAKGTNGVTSFQGFIQPALPVQSRLATEQDETTSRGRARRQGLALLAGSASISIATIAALVSLLI
jgi:hypothetical protein